MSNDYWTLINLNSDDPIAESKPIYFSSSPKYFQQFSLSGNKDKLYFVINTDREEIKFYEIDYNDLFEKDYSDRLSPLDIGQGRTIEIAEN